MLSVDELNFCDKYISGKTLLPVYYVSKFCNALLHYTSQVCNQSVVEYLIKCVSDVNVLIRHVTK